MLESFEVTNFYKKVKPYLDPPLDVQIKTVKEDILELGESEEK